MNFLELHNSQIGNLNSCTELEKVRGTSQNHTVRVMIKSVRVHGKIRDLIILYIHTVRTKKVCERESNLCLLRTSYAIMVY